MILKAESPPRIGERAIDENLNTVGTIFDVFGPVSSPYVAVRPSVEDPNLFVEHTLYAVAVSKPRREKRKR